jgi:hypothetical protein
VLRRRHERQHGSQDGTGARCPASCRSRNRRGCSNRAVPRSAGAVHERIQPGAEPVERARRDDHQPEGSSNATAASRNRRTADAGVPSVRPMRRAGSATSARHMVQRRSAFRAEEAASQSWAFPGRPPTGDAGSCHIGGFTPAFSTVTLLATRLPSGLVMAIAKTATPCCNRFASPGANVTTGVSGSITISVSPPL